MPANSWCWRRSGAAGRLPWTLCGLALLSLAAWTAGPAVAGVRSDELRARLQHSGDVNDFAGILSPAERESLAERCRSLRAKTGAGFVIVILNSLEGGQIDDFTNKLFKQWGVGQQGKDNGLLLVVALRDRKARLEVGYGLEPILPDALAGRILDEQLFPAFKQQRYGDGLQAAVQRAAELIERGEPAPKEARQKSGALTPGEKSLLTAFLGLFVALGTFLLGFGLGARFWPLGAFGAFFGGVPYVLSLAMASPVGPLFLTPLAVLVTIGGFRIGRAHGVGGRGGGGGWGGGASQPWTWQSFGDSSGWSSSSWSGGGFSADAGSFGGGSSGGGGASGGW